MFRARATATVLAAFAALGAATAPAGAAPGPADRLGVTPQPTTSPAVSLTAPTRVMPVGDSLTDQGYRIGYRGWMLHLFSVNRRPVDLVGSVAQPGWYYRDNQHEGHPGWRLDQLTPRAYTSVRYYRPDVVVLLAGSNDLEQGHGAATATTRMNTLLDTIAGAKPGTRVVVNTLPPDTWAPADQITAFNRALPGVVARQQRLRRPVVLSDVAGVITTAETLDGCHPDDVGGRKLGEAIGKNVLPYLHR
ncbi:SGNH/GDSL hydrolase family protein [Arsenicicoccus dermatophilus]|uniref:SGNH/GDSL hydrolase family protein n=1 Tax=Arsenicicoccus dermatophilus TaxID=1076331 RepID=UPI003916FB57